MKKIILSSATAMVLATSASAFMGINTEIGGGMWQPALSGCVKYQGSKIDFDTLGIDDKTTSGNNYIYADFSHFIPLIPNARIEKLNYNLSGNSTLTTAIFSGYNFTGNVKTNIDMKQTDIIAYWGVPFIGLATGGIVNINFGLDAKNLKGSMTLQKLLITKSVNFDKTLPLLYLNAKVDIPFLPVDLSATTKTLSYDGATISDNEAKASFTLPIPMPLIDIKFDVGYKTQNITIPNSLVKDLDADIDTKGLFFGMSAKF